MDRTVTIQVIALFVVLNALLRWLPDDDPRDPLGMGQPWEVLRLDSQLQDVGPDTEDARILLRLLSRPAKEQAAYASHLRKLLSRLRSVQESADEETLVQFKGVPRNDLWSFMALLYPIRHTFYTHEEGSRHDDESIEGARVVKVKIVPWSEVPRDQWPEQAEDKVNVAVPGSGGGGR